MRIVLLLLFTLSSTVVGAADHEALWVQAFKYFPSTNQKLADRATRLAELTPYVQQVLSVAKENGDLAFYHYVQARFAGIYNNFDRALDEIDQAIRLQPHRSRFLLAKGKFLAAKGAWEKQDRFIDAAVRTLKDGLHAYLQETTHESTHDAADFYFTIAYSTARRSVERHQEVVAYYLQAIAHGNDHSTRTAFAWNNVSETYQKLNQCAKGKDAAEHALAIRNFAAASNNKALSEFCLEMAEHVRQ